MTLLTIIASERTELSSMKDTELLNYSVNEHMKKIKKHSDCKKIMRLFQLIAELSYKYNGMSFMRNKKMADIIGVSVRTIQRYTNLLERLGIMLKIPTNRENNRGQASNTYVILPVLKKACHGGCHPLIPSFMPLKQEKDIIKDSSISDSKNFKEPKENSENLIEPKKNEDENILRYLFNRIQDAKKNRKSGIQYLSSYVDTLVKREIRKAKANELMKQSKERKARQKPTQTETVPFYNWLEQVEKPKKEKGKFDNKELDELGVW